MSASATWCGQCFATLEEPKGRAVGTMTAEVQAATERRPPFWPCPVCGEENAIALDACAVCGTPFAAAMRADAERPHVPPRDAAMRSLVFPGLGHALVGRGADGLARGVLFAVTAGIAILLGLATAGSGALTASFLLFVLAAVAVYAMSAFEAYQLAAGGDLLIATPTLVWIVLGVVFAGIGLLAYGVITATRR